MSIQAPVVRMRRCFVDILHAKMAKDPSIWVVTADLGFKMWDEIERDYPKRFLNIGAAEQLLVGVGVGLALEGKVPVLYSITPFLLYRAFESIRNYVHYESIPVKLICSGRDKDYSHDGFSHWACEDRDVMKIFSNIRASWPESNEELPGLVDEIFSTKAPYYMNLKK